MNDLVDSLVLAPLHPRPPLPDLRAGLRSGSRLRLTGGVVPWKRVGFPQSGGARVRVRVHVHVHVDQGALSKHFSPNQVCWERWHSSARTATHVRYACPTCTPVERVHAIRARAMGSSQPRACGEVPTQQDQT